MKITLVKSILKAVIAIAFVMTFSQSVKADTAAASDRAFEMASKYSAMGFYMTPSKEGYGGFGVTLEFEVPVSRGLDYVFIAAGDRNCQALSVYIESEGTGNTIVKDNRRVMNGLAGVRWRSDYNGTVNVVVHFARVSDRCGWSALVGRRGTAAKTLDPGSEISTTPGSAQKMEGNTPTNTSAVP